MRANRAKLITDAQALIPNDGTAMSAENRTKFDTMMADSDLMKGDIDRVERAAAAEAELRTLVPTPAPAIVAAGVPQAEAEAREAKYQAAFRNFLRRGPEGVTGEDRSLLMERRAQSDTVGAQGAFLIPSGFQHELEVALKYYGGIRSAARSITTSTGNPLPWPTTNDVMNMGVRLGKATVPGTAPEQDLSFGQVQFGAYTYTSKAIVVPNELLQDSAFDLEAHIKEQFVTRLGRIQNNEFTLNNDGAGPQGIVPFAVAGATGAVGVTGETLTMIYDDLVNTEHALDKAYRTGAKWMLNDLTFSVIRKIKDTLGRPLLSPGIDGGDPDKILGYEYVINNDMAVPAADAVTLLFGQYQKYVVRDIANTMAILRLDQLYALQNQTAFVAFMRSDARGIDAGTHPIVTFTQSHT